MPLTRQQKKNAMKHILENVFDFDEGSNLHRVFAKAAVNQPADILCMPGDAARTLKYKDDDGNIQQIQAGHVGLIIMFQHFVSHYQSHNGIIAGEGWIHLTADKFDEYRINFNSISNKSTATPSIVNLPWHNQGNWNQQFKTQPTIQSAGNPATSNLCAETSADYKPKQLPINTNPHVSTDGENGLQNQLTFVSVINGEKTYQLPIEEKARKQPSLEAPYSTQNLFPPGVKDTTLQRPPPAPNLSNNNCHSGPPATANNGCARVPQISPNYPSVGHTSVVLKDHEERLQTSGEALQQSTMPALLGQESSHKIATNVLLWNFYQDFLMYNTAGEWDNGEAPNSPLLCTVSYNHQRGDTLFKFWLYLLFWQGKLPTKTQANQLRTALWRACTQELSPCMDLFCNHPKPHGTTDSPTLSMTKVFFLDDLNQTFGCAHLKEPNLLTSILEQTLTVIRKGLSAYIH